MCVCVHVYLMTAHSLSGTSLRLLEELKVGIFWASWHFHGLWCFAFSSFFKRRNGYGGKNPYLMGLKGSSDSQMS